MLVAFSAIQILAIISIISGGTVMAERRGYGSFWLSIGAFCAVAYASFWIVFFLPSSAPLLKYAFWIAAILMAPLSAFQKNYDAKVAFGLWFIATVGIVAWAFYPYSDGSIVDFAAQRWSHPLPLDNRIPLLFADALEAGNIPSPLVGDWLSSDRPPLQTGFFLLTHLPFVDREVAYQLSSTSAQMAIVPAVFLLIRALGGDFRTGIAGAIGVFFTPIVLVNGIFVWPKLLPAALLCGTFAIHFLGTRTRIADGLTVGFITASSMLLHGGALLSLIGFAITALAVRKIGSLRYVATAVITIAALYAPWTIYQKSFDPSGDRLLKWHFAGVSAPDDRQFVQTMKESYSAITLDEAIARRIGNVAHSLSEPLSAYDPEVATDRKRANAFFKMMPAIGFIGLIAYLAMPIGLIDPRHRAFLFSGISTYAVWILLMFDAKSAIVHQGSYLMVLTPAILIFLTASRIKYLPILLAIVQGTWAAYVYM